MKEYKINISKRPSEHYGTMIIRERSTGEDVAEYRLTVGKEETEVKQMRRTIDKHLAGGGTLGNYQF